MKTLIRPALTLFILLSLITGLIYPDVYKRQPGSSGGADLTLIHRCPITLPLHAEALYGSHLSRWNIVVFYAGRRPSGRLRQTGRYPMTWLYILGSLVSVGLLIYLVAALLMAEDL